MTLIANYFTIMMPKVMPKIIESIVETIAKRKFSKVSEIVSFESNLCILRHFQKKILIPKDVTMTTNLLETELI